MSAEAEAAFVRHALWLRPEANRTGALRDALGALPEGSLEGLVPRLEMHGILGLVDRNLRLAGEDWPAAAAAPVAARLAVLRADARRARLTLDRFLRAAARERLDVVLLKGASLALDVYEEGHWRAQGDVDVLVPASGLRRAIAAAEESGLSFSERQFPLWWYRLVHFHAKLHPATALQQPLEVHWRLQSPALMLTCDLRRILARAAPVPSSGAGVRTLERLDRWLHLATHLASHAHGRIGPGVVAAALADSDPEVRLKWLVDLVAETEALAGHHGVDEAVARTREWGASREVRAVAAMLAGEELLPPGSRAREWCDALGGALRRTPAASGSGESPRSRARGGASARSHHALDFRIAALRLWPRWAWPPLDFVRRRYALGSGASGSAAAVVVRFGHLAGVLGRTLLAGIALPVAIASRAALGPARRRRRSAALDPEKALDLVASWRGNEGP